MNDANDLLYAGGEMQWFEGKRIDNPNTHGTGCTLERHRVEPRQGLLAQRVRRAGEGVHLRRAVGNAGPRQGAGPMQHNFDLRGEFAKENTK